MIIIRRIAKDDFTGYVQLAFQAHINFYTLPKSERLLEHRFDRALHSFSESYVEPDNQFYLFVAEDTATKKLLGVAAISATSGGNEPLYFFRLEYATVNSPLSEVVKQLPILNPVSYARGPSEVGSLFVDPQARGSGVGKLLSFSRFLFAACFLERFTGSFISELRGPIHDGTSLFWEAIGKHFFDVSFTKVQEMMNYGRSFIGQFLPQYPIYVDLLPKIVQDAIGKVDKETQGAYDLLVRQGFEVTNEIDVIDGGPKLLAKKENIRAILRSKRVYVAKIEDVDQHVQHYFVSNERLDFRATSTPLAFIDDDTVGISAEAAAHLNIGIGEYVRILNPKSI